MVRIASETTAPGHKGGSDSELSGGLTDEEFDRSGTECKLLQIQHNIIVSQARPTSARAEVGLVCETKY